MVFDSLRIGGISGIIGNPIKPFRKTADSYASIFNYMTEGVLDILLLHDGPDYPDLINAGNKENREKLQAVFHPLLVFRGNELEFVYGTAK